MFTIAPSTGKLTVVKGSLFLPPSGTSEPSWVTVDPTGRYVYAANGGSFGTGGASVYSINANTGALTLVGTPIAGGTLPWSITTDVEGRFVYMTNNDSTVDGYAIDNTTGGLTKLTGSPFSASGPSRGVAVDPSGKFLYFADSSLLEGDSINASTGALKVLAGSPYSAGSGPIDVCVAGTIK